MSQSEPRLVPWGIGTATQSEPLTEIPLAKPIEARLTRKAVIFVHGIFSSHETFAAAHVRMIQTPALADVEFHYFDYPFNESMEANGLRLAVALRAAGFAESDYVALVAHSMGGLVSRFAILSQRLEFVRVLFMLGTPNAGALRLSQLTALAQLAHGATNRLFTLFPRRSGVSSLSNAAALIEAKRADFRNAIGINYVSIPGRFFHEERSRWELPRHASGASFATLEAMLMRLVAIRLTRPHDGVVEESSNRLSTCRRSTEKSDSYGGPRGDRPATYGHLTLAACAEVNHVEIHADPVIVDVVSEVIAYKFAGAPRRSLEDWFKSLSSEVLLSYDVQMSFDR